MLFRFGAFELDADARELRLRGVELPLQPRVLDLLLLLVRNRQRVVPKDELMASLWPNVTVGEGSLQRAVSLARAALREGGAASSLRNYPRQGYRFVGEVVAEEPTRKPGSLRAPSETVAEEAAELERRSNEARLAGRGGEAIEPLERAVRLYLEREDVPAAVRAATQVAEIHYERRELAVAKGWLSRAARFLPEGAETSELGLLKAVASRVALAEGDLERALALGEEAQRIGKATKDPDVEVLGLLYRGLALLARGEVSRGIELQDEAGAAVVGAGVGAWSGGIVYCGVILGCLHRGDWGRAGEWTGQLERWCARHELGSFPGLCRLHRAEVLWLRGELGEAEAEVLGACAQLAKSAPWAEGDGHRVLGEILIEKGDLDGAEAAFRRAHELGWDPQPGWALLQLARGRPDSAVRALERALSGTQWTHLQRRGALLAHLAVVSALAGDAARARWAVAELDAHAELWSTPAYGALVARARAELALAEGDRPGAIEHLQRAVRLASEIEACFTFAEGRTRLAEVLLEDDPEAARLELDAAEAAFLRAGARRRLERCAELRRAIRERLHGAPR